MKKEEEKKNKTKTSSKKVKLDTVVEAESKIKPVKISKKEKEIKLDSEVKSSKVKISSDKVKKISKIKELTPLKNDRMFSAKGGRKESSAVVKLFFNEDGNKDLSIDINNINIEDYFKNKIDINNVKIPFLIFFENNTSSVKVKVQVKGGGSSGQAGAISLAASIALSKFSEDLRKSLKEKGLITRDDRVVESKRAGYRKARKSEQFSKR